MAFSTSQFASMTVAGALLLAACSSEGAIDAAKDTVADNTTTTASEVTETSVEETTTTTTAAETTTTTVEEATTSTTTTAAAGPADGVLFTDPAGDYSMMISPDWTDASAEFEASAVFPAGVYGWYTGSLTTDFLENINILTDSIPNATPLTAILDASTTQVENQFDGFNLIASGVQTRPGQTDVGVLEYTAVQEGVEIRFLQVFGVWNDTLVVFTGSTDARNGSEGVERLRPYALTLGPPA